MNTEPAKHNIASVVLNYNSDADVMMLVPQLLAQENILHNIFIIDNASNHESVKRLQSWVQGMYPGAVVGSPAEISKQIENGGVSHADSNLYLVLNNENRGYSAGNNIGIRLAEALGAEAVLIANPDMRIEYPQYIEELAKGLFTNEKNSVAASRILDLDRNDQNPLREASFLEEFFWPRWWFRKFLTEKSYVIPYCENRSGVVPKVSGCCLLLRMSFLQKIQYLNEEVFLYCEEPILSAQVQQKDGNIFYVPTLTATHAHVKGRKGDTAKQMLLFIKSRKYYLKTYRGFKKWQLFLLDISYALLAIYNILKGVGNRMKNFYVTFKSTHKSSGSCSDLK